MKLFEETWRWFGPDDPVTLSDIRQTGATGIVTALHHVPNGEVWSHDAIEHHKSLIESAGLRWTVVESLPVTEAIKQGTGMAEQHLEAYKASLRNLAACDVRVITYNFMPVLDWTRTDLDYRMHDGSSGLRFDMDAMTAFDVFILRRPNAEASYDHKTIERAKQYYSRLSKEEVETLTRNIIAGLPGSEEHYGLDQFREMLAAYEAIGARQLRENLARFLREVVPVAEECGLRLAIHPDDPPFSLLGLPRVVSNSDDVRFILGAYPSEANGICFCTGSLAADPDNDLAAMVSEFGSNTHFVHLRNITREGNGSFYEADHLGGDVDMYNVITAFNKTITNNRPVPMRPDHGHVLLDDSRKTTLPGYSAVGRLRGLAELRGLTYGITGEF